MFTWAGYVFLLFDWSFCFGKGGSLFWKGVFVYIRLTSH
jgi:hypothetical protein